MRSVPDASQWSVRWSSGGESVAIAINDIEIGAMSLAEQRGVSRYLTASGPWGVPWDDGLVARLF